MDPRRKARSVVAMLMTATFVGMPDGTVVVIVTLENRYIGELDDVLDALESYFAGTASGMSPPRVGRAIPMPAIGGWKHEAI